MNHSVYAVAPGVMLPPAPPASVATDLLRQMIELQREHLDFVRKQQAAQDERQKWANFHGRWAGEYPDLPALCKTVLPKVERAYMGLLQDITEAVAAEDDFDNEYTLAEFLDKYSVRIAQLGNLLGPMNHMANVAPPAEAPAE